MRRGAAIAAAGVLLLFVGIGIAAGGNSGRIGPDIGLLGNGRQLDPAGTLVKLGNFPTGGAVTPDGRFYWTVSTGRGFNDIRIVSLADARVVQVVPIPGASGGIAMDPVRNLAYVSGVADSAHKDEQRTGLPGRDGDVVQVFSYDPVTGHAEFSKLLPVPPPSGSPIPQGIVAVPGLGGPPQSFPPTNTQPVAWPDRLAVSPDGKTLLVPLNLADSAAVVDTGSGQVRYVNVGHYPYGAAILPGGHTGLVSNETDGTVSVIDLDSASKVKDIQVGPHLSHPEAIAVDPSGNRAYVAVANSDQVAVIDTSSMQVERTLSLDWPDGRGSAPVALSVTPDGSRLVVAESGTDDIAVFGLPGGAGTPYELIGRVPTADYPADVQVAPDAGCTSGPCLRLAYIAAKGLGVGPNPNGPSPLTTNDDNSQSVQYLPDIVTGDAGVLDFPSDSQLAQLTPVATRQVHPTNAAKPPPQTPIRPDGPIKHVFYIVRENRTYDQVLGDDPRGDGDPSLELFGPHETPNLHALVNRFPLVDHVYANSEASIDGHFWTSAASVSDYVHKNWFQNYAARGRPYDFGVYAVTWPANGFLFDQAEHQGIPYFNYGEAIAGVVPLTDKDRNAQDTAEVARKLAHSDIGPPDGCYPNDSSINTDSITQQQTWDSTPPQGAPATAESRFDCFKKRFSAELTTDTVPAFNYLVLPNDHTVGTTPGQRTPQALIADNDYGLGQIVDLISHSPIWKSSAIFVIEDDSQDGADHVDAHRIPAAVISPYAKRGAVVHDRYDFLSVIRTMELILGMKPLGLWDNLATPMYAAFQGTPSNAEPYNAIVPAQSRLATNSATAANAALSRSLHLDHTDDVPQRELDRILWQSVHGAHSQPPPPGPNAQRGG
ncbi:MAG TPA: alkaline phosphatase family protein [Thermoleophilaceae bacterium]